jgi:hypothetical protein
MVKESYLEYVNSGDLSLLSELHSSSAGLKAYITLNVSEGVEACRKMCGGHGFLVNAGFAELYTSYLPFCTLEGTKEVLQQQMGRFLLKQFIMAINIKKKNSLEKSPKNLLSPSTLYFLNFSKSKSKFFDFNLFFEIFKIDFLMDFSILENQIINAFQTRFSNQIILLFVCWLSYLCLWLVCIFV